MSCNVTSLNLAGEKNEDVSWDTSENKPSKKLDIPVFLFVVVVVGIKNTINQQLYIIPYFDLYMISLIILYTFCLSGVNRLCFLLPIVRVY